MMARASALVVIGAILVGACACGNGSGSRTAAPPPSLSWHDCGHFKCATLSVPVSYSDPGGPQVPISVIELAASRPKPLGDILLNPGGPGESGVDFLERDSRMFPASLHAKFNLVSFDPRGVGSSQPLRCLTSKGIIDWISVNPAPTTPQQIRHVVRASKAFIRGCEKSASPTFISSMSTPNTVRDMDRLRAALGGSKLTYVGFSYGTFLGTVYAEMFPKHVRAMVLDGALDPAVGTETSESTQAAGFETDLHDFFAWCSSDRDCASGFPTTPARAFGGLMARFERGLVIPAHLAPRYGGRQRVDYGVALLGVASALYSKAAWPFLGQSLATAEKGDGSLLAASAYGYAGQNADGSFSNILSANMATVCLDRPAPRTIEAYKALASRLGKSAPDFGPSEAWGTLPCAYWPSPAQGHAAPAHAPGAPPILVVGSTRDPATPYSWAKALAKELPRATLLTRTGAGHTAYRSSACIRKWVDRYLETLRMPPAGTVCPSD